MFDVEITLNTGDEIVITTETTLRKAKREAERTAVAGFFDPTDSEWVMPKNIRSIDINPVVV